MRDASVMLQVEKWGYCPLHAGHMPLQTFLFDGKSTHRSCCSFICPLHHSVAHYSGTANPSLSLGEAHLMDLYHTTMVSTNALGDGVKRQNGALAAAAFAKVCWSVG